MVEANTKKMKTDSESELPSAFIFGRLFSHVPEVLTNLANEKKERMGEREEIRKETILNFIFNLFNRRTSEQHNEH